MSPEVRAIRVGITVIVGLFLLIAGIFLIGEKETLFVRKVPYYVEFDSVGGLTSGSPVQLNGVIVGKVKDVVLPADTGENLLRVDITIERQYAPRVREDSLARIQTLGLLGDKYIAVTSGRPSFPPIEEGGRIAAAPVTDVDTLLASGGDAVEDIVSTAGSLARLLARMERGEGLLGQLLVEREGQDVLENINRTLSSVESIAESIDQGSGPIGRLIHDEALAQELEETVRRTNSILRSFHEGDGLLPSLLHDTATKAAFDSTLQNLDQTSAELTSLMTEMQSGKGILPRLINDDELADEWTQEIQELLDRLNGITTKLDEGDGTAALLLNDPQIYDALNDILVGIDESKFLRWLVRNRQKKGIENRYEASRGNVEEEG